MRFNVLFLYTITVIIFTAGAVDELRLSTVKNCSYFSKEISGCPFAEEWFIKYKDFNNIVITI